MEIRNPKSEIRNDMMTGSSYEPSQNVILSEARRRRAKSKDLRVGGPRQFRIPNSEFRLHRHTFRLVIQAMPRIGTADMR